MTITGQVTRLPRKTTVSPRRPSSGSSHIASGRTLVGQNMHRFLLIAALADPDWAEPIRWIESCGGLLVQGPNRMFPRDWLDDAPDDFDLVLIDCEFLGEFEDVVEYALGLRLRAPTLPVLVASRLFARHDFSTQRSAICDCALKLPCSRSALFLGLSAAMDNRASRRALA